MDFTFSEQQVAIRENVARLCAKYDADFWLETDRSKKFPDDFVADMAAAGWLGIAMPEEYGGAGLGVTEAAIMMQAVAESGAAMTGVTVTWSSQDTNVATVNSGGTVATVNVGNTTRIPGR